MRARKSEGEMLIEDDPLRVTREKTFGWEVCTALVGFQDGDIWSGAKAYL